jgi:saccharopine dehydrogenase-like NADP-dependent oxidoreductase
VSCAGRVGSAAVGIANRHDFFDAMVVGDYDLGRAERAVASADRRIRAVQVDASTANSVADLCREHAITHVVNAVDPRFVMRIFDGAVAADVDYLDMAMSLSRPHPQPPFAQCGVKLGDEQFAAARKWEGARAVGHRRHGR